VQEMVIMHQSLMLLGICDIKLWHQFMRNGRYMEIWHSTTQANTNALRIKQE